MGQLIPSLVSSEEIPYLIQINQPSSREHLIALLVIAQGRIRSKVLEYDVSPFDQYKTISLSYYSFYY